MIRDIRKHSQPPPIIGNDTFLIFIYQVKLSVSVLISADVCFLFKGAGTLDSSSTGYLTIAWTSCEQILILWEYGNVSYHCEYSWTIFPLKLLAGNVATGKGAHLPCLTPPPSKSVGGRKGKGKRERERRCLKEFQRALLILIAERTIKMYAN